MTLKSVTGSTGLQNARLNMLRATWNPLKQCRLPMRLLCVPYFQETSGTHRFCGPGYIFKQLRHFRNRRRGDRYDAPKNSLI